MVEISEKTKEWLFSHFQNARDDMHEAHDSYEYREASEKYGIFCEIIGRLELWDDAKERGVW